MPEINNCLTCRWEPEWAHDEFHTISGWCKLRPVLPVWWIIDTPKIIRRKTGHIEVRYSDKSIFSFSKDCPAHQPKGGGEE